MTGLVSPIPRYPTKARTAKACAQRAALGIPSRIDRERVACHLEWLLGIGFSETAVAAAAGCPKTTVNQILARRYERTWVEVAARVLQVGHVPVPAQAGTLVSPVGTVRRLHALRAAGWSQRDLATHLGVVQQRVSAYSRARQVRYATYVGVRDLYDEWSAIPGAVRAARSGKGLLLPLEWEGYDIDDPRVTPPRTRRDPNSGLSEGKAARLDSVRELVGWGVPGEVIATRLGVSHRQIERDLRELAS